MDAPRRHAEKFCYPRGIDIAGMKQFCGHVPCIDNFSLTGFRQNRIFWHIKFLGNEFKHMVGEFSDLRHSVGICLKFYFGREQNSTPRV